MSFIVPMEKPKRCGLCPCFHAEHPMHCQAVKAHKDKRIIAPYGAPIPDWCPLIELPPHGRLGDLDKLIDSCKQYMNMLDPESKEYTKIFALKCYLVAVAEEAVIEAEGETDGR